jgi:hypothetical protein
LYTLLEGLLVGGVFWTATVRATLIGCHAQRHTE